jgi:hypothetical protein
MIIENLFHPKESKDKPGTVAHAAIPTTQEAKVRRITVPSQPRQKKLTRPPSQGDGGVHLSSQLWQKGRPDLKNNQSKKGRSMAQVVEFPPDKP